MKDTEVFAPSILFPNESVLVWVDRTVKQDYAGRNRTHLTGALKVPLDYFDADSPTITLRVKAILAVEQPAKNGPILLHCGGPGSIDDCAEKVLHTGAIQGWDDAYDAYDAIGITQRGMNINNGPFSPGDYEMPTDSPSLDCPAGTRFYPTPDPTRTTAYGLKDFTSCDCDLPEEGYSGPIPTPLPDTTDRTQVLHWLQFAESRNKRCYNSPQWTMEGKNGTTYNFLNYVGTWMLAQDLDTLRAAIGAPKLSIHGFSYGTGVGATYAATFPKNTGRLILNGNIQTGQDGTRDVLSNQAGATAICLRRLLQICEDSPKIEPQLLKPGDENPCHMVGDQSAKFRELWARAKSGMLVAPMKNDAPFTLSATMLSFYIPGTLYDQSGDGWVGMVNTLVKLISPNATTSQAEIALILDAVCGHYYWWEFGYCANYMKPMLTTVAVRGQDYDGRYTYTSAAAFYETVVRQYDEYSTSGILADNDQLASFSWGATPSPANLGWRENIPAIIVGSLYDCATPYANARWMRAAFPGASLMTWQGVGHCVDNAKYDAESVAACNRQMANYLRTGDLPLDGFTCRSHAILHSATSQKKRSSMANSK